MSRIIPREMIKHLEWTPGKELPESPKIDFELIKVNFTIEELIKNGKPFYSNKQDSQGNSIGVADSLQQAETYAGSEGIVASMPQLIAGKSLTDKKSYLWKDWFTALSQENIGIDRKGTLVKAGSPVVVTVHGGGILSYGRILDAYGDGLTPQSAAKLSEEEFSLLLKGTLPDGRSIPIYRIEDVQRGYIPHPFGVFGVAMDFETAKSTKNGQQQKKEFMRGLEDRNLFFTRESQDANFTSSLIPTLMQILLFLIP